MMLHAGARQACHGLSKTEVRLRSAEFKCQVQPVGVWRAKLNKASGWDSKYRQAWRIGGSGELCCRLSGTSKRRCAGSKPLYRLCKLRLAFWGLATACTAEADPQSTPDPGLHADQQGGGTQKKTWIQELKGAWCNHIQYSHCSKCEGWELQVESLLACPYWMLRWHIGSLLWNSSSWCGRAKLEQQPSHWTPFATKMLQRFSL